MTYLTIIAELEEYCRRAGLKASTVCVKALNDSRYPTRHARRLEVLDRDANKLRRYMKDNPPPEKDDAA